MIQLELRLKLRLELHLELRLKFSKLKALHLFMPTMI